MDDFERVVAFQELLAASEAFLAELDSGNDFKAWEIAKDNLRAAVLKAKGIDNG